MTHCKTEAAAKKEETKIKKQQKNEK